MVSFCLTKITSSFRISLLLIPSGLVAVTMPKNSKSFLKKLYENEKALEIEYGSRVNILSAAYWYL